MAFPEIIFLSDELGPPIIVLFAEDINDIPVVLASAAFPAAFKPI